MKKKLVLLAVFLAGYTGAFLAAKKHYPVVFRAKTEVERTSLFCTLGLSDESGSYSPRRVGIRNIFINFRTSFPARQVEAIRGGGALPMVTWEPYVELLETDSLLPAIAAGEYDAYITEFARQSGPDPLLIRFAHEPNGDWYGWCGTRSGAAVYIEAFRRVRRIFNAVGSGAKFVFCVNAEDVPASEVNRFEIYYPGSAYVDAVGLDAFNWGATPMRSWRTPGTLLTPAYERAVRAFPDKPLLLAETATASAGGNKANWISTLLAQQPWRFPAIKAVIWFNMDKERDWAIASGHDAQVFFGACGVRGICCEPNVMINLLWGKDDKRGIP